MSRRKKGGDAVGLSEAGETSRQVDNFERGTTRLSGALPCDQDGERRRIELHERRTIDTSRACRDSLQTGRERGFRARMRQRRAGFEAAGVACGCTGRCIHRSAHDCLPAASC